MGPKEIFTNNSITLPGGYAEASKAKRFSMLQFFPVTVTLNFTPVKIIYKGKIYKQTILMKISILFLGLRRY